MIKFIIQKWKLQIYQDKAVHINWQARQGKQARDYGNSEEAVKINSSGGRIFLQDNC